MDTVPVPIPDLSAKDPNIVGTPEFDTGLTAHYPFLSSSCTPRARVCLSFAGDGYIPSAGRPGGFLGYSPSFDLPFFPHKTRRRIL